MSLIIATHLGALVLAALAIPQSFHQIPMAFSSASHDQQRAVEHIFASIVLVVF